MTRMISLVVVLAGAFGLAVGWLVSTSRVEPDAGETHDVGMMPGTVVVESGRHEFPLRAEDVAEDRETPSVAADARGRVLLAWAAVSGESERTIHLACSADGGKTFDRPAPFRKVPIYRYTSRRNDKAMAYSTHALPRVIAVAGAFQLGWVEAIDGGPEVRFYVATSTDGGKTFSQPEPVHSKDASRPGFTALSASVDGSLLAAWLDGHNGRPQPFFAQRAAASAGFDREVLVFAGPEGKGICPCCDLAAVTLSDGSNFVAFRNTDQGHRDIWFARAPHGGTFGPAIPLALDNWTYTGCPHDGPSLVGQGEHVVAAWMSGHSGRNRVYAASASTADLTFRPRELNPGTTGAQGHPKLAATPTGRLCAVWDESPGASPARVAKSGDDKEKHHGHSLAGGGRTVMLARAANDGSMFGPAIAVSPRPGAFQLNPAVAIGSDGAILIAWNEIDTTGKRVVFVRREPEPESHP